MPHIGHSACKMIEHLGILPLLAGCIGLQDLIPSAESYQCHCRYHIVPLRIEVMFKGLAAYDDLIPQAMVNGQTIPVHSCIHCAKGLDSEYMDIFKFPDL